MRTRASVVSLLITTLLLWGSPAAWAGPAPSAPGGQKAGAPGDQKVGTAGDKKAGAPGAQKAGTAGDKKAGASGDKKDAAAGNGKSIAVGGMKAGAGSASGSNPRYRTVVVGRLGDADPVGSYRQPVWTTKRQFTTTRVYVLPKGESEIEYWLTTKGDLKSGTGPEFESQLEVSFGLGKRLQLDFYLAMAQAHYDSPLRLAAEKIELRYAFADWGRLWGNPTLYLEWARQHDAPMKAEAKLLFGGNLTSKLFWGLNLVYESELGRDYEQEWAVSFGLAGVLKRRLVLLGVEAKIDGAHIQDGKTARFADMSFQIGPSLAIRPGRFHLLIVPLFGVKHVRGLEPGESNETKGVYTIYAILGVNI